MLEVLLVILGLCAGVILTMIFGDMSGESYKNGAHDMNAYHSAKDRGKLYAPGMTYVLKRLKLAGLIY